MLIAYIRNLFCYLSSSSVTIGTQWWENISPILVKENQCLGGWHVSMGEFSQLTLLRSEKKEDNSQSSLSLSHTSCCQGCEWTIIWRLQHLRKAASMHEQSFILCKRVTHNNCLLVLNALCADISHHLHSLSLSLSLYIYIYMYTYTYTHLACTHKS